MKIEETPFQFSNTTATPSDKNRAGSGLSGLGGFEDLDLSFMDMLTSLSTSSQAVNGAHSRASTESRLGQSRTETASGQPDQAKSSKQTKLSLVSSSEQANNAADNAPSDVERDMALLHTDLTASDIQYMKQTVIPGLPILMGSVPIESVFPREAGQFSYRGHDVSPKLTELLEKGYKTGRPIRVELDSKSAVVLKIRNGQVSAEFVSTDRSMALVMQQELDDLRHRMAMKNLPFGTLEAKYQDSRQSRQEQPDQSGHHGTTSSDAE